MSTTDEDWKKMKEEWHDRLEKNRSTLVVTNKNFYQSPQSLESVMNRMEKLEDLLCDVVELAKAASGESDNIGSDLRKVVAALTGKKSDSE